MGGSPGELNKDLVTQEKRKKAWRMNCDVGEATERVGELAVTQVKRRKGCRMSCDVGEMTKRLENELCRALVSCPWHSTIELFRTNTDP